MVQSVSVLDPTADSPAAIATLDVGGMKCAGCVGAVERQLKQNSGVLSASVNLITEVAVVHYQPSQLDPQQLANHLSERGFPSQLRQAEDDTFKALSNQLHKTEALQQQRQGLIVAVVLILFSGLGHLDHLGGPHLPVISELGFHWLLATLALLIPGREILIDGAKSLRHGLPNMNTLVSLGTLSAYFASCWAFLVPSLGWECFFDEPVMLLGFILLGRTLEKQARHRAAAALTSLLALQPAIARLIGRAPGSQGIEIPVAQVRVGEWIQVLPSEKIPVDGLVVNGSGAVDESLVTGESLPVLKQPGDRAIAGSFNQSGVLILEATRIGRDTTLAQIIQSVAEAQTRKAPIQQLADTVAGYFSYGVLVIAALTLGFWLTLGVDLFPEVLSHSVSYASHGAMGAMASMPTSPLLLSLKLAIAVLVVACPCALGLATPTAILVGTGIGAEKGLLIKGGDILERANKITTLVFDKTGTLTQGTPEIEHYQLFSAPSPEQLLQWAASVEQGTRHPLAQTLVDSAQHQGLSLLAATEFHTEPGLGVRARIEGEIYLTGNLAWLAQHHVDLTPLADAPTPLGTAVYVAQAQTLLGVLTLTDPLRADAPATLEALRQRGLKTILLTGDRAAIAQVIAAQVGISEVYSEVHPQQKVDLIQQLQATGEVVAMVGDGINDAPALAQADLGISLAGSTEVALATADIVLMRSQLADLLLALDLSRATVQKIRQNLLWALGYNLITIPIAAGALLPHWQITLSPAIAAGLMATSSVLVVSNSLSLRLRFSR